MKTQTDKPLLIAGLPPKEYAALWGDEAGALCFYNYSSENQKLDLFFYEHFIRRIFDIRRDVRCRPADYDPQDYEELGQLLDFVYTEYRTLDTKK